MKRVISVIASGLVMTVMSFAKTTWLVDNVHSRVKFTVSHLVISEVEGSFKVYSGSLQANPDFSNTAIDFSVDANSVNTENEMRDKHLKSDDFFNAEKYPAMTFKSAVWKKIDAEWFVGALSFTSDAPAPVPVPSP